MRIRTIKPEFWRSDDITALDWATRLLFIGLWSYVDDNGVGIDDERRVTADLFGLEDDPVAIREMVREGLATLSRRSLIVRYEVGGKRWLAVAKWADHQKIDKPGKARYPSPCQAEPVVNAGVQATTAPNEGNSREGLATVSRLEQGNRGTGEQGNNNPSPAGADAAIVRPEVDRLCELLADLIEGNGSKRPVVTARWRTACRLMLDADKRTEAQIEKAMRWCQADEFWRPNILSMPKLREKYDQLRLAAQRAPVAARVQTGTDDKIAATLAMGQRFADQGNYAAREITR